MIGIIYGGHLVSAKAKVTKEMIGAAAFDIARESGADNINHTQSTRR